MALDEFINGVNEDMIGTDTFIDEQELAMAEAEAEFNEQQQMEQLVQKIQNRLDWCKSSHDRTNAEKRWEDCQNFWLGKQWDGIKSFGIRGRDADSKKLHPNPVDNYFKSHIEGLLGDMTDRPVDIQVKPREEGDDEIARKLSETINYLWYRNKGDRKLEYIIRRGLLYGPLIAKVYWDNTWVGSPGNPFVGDVRFFGVLPTNIFIDPRVKGTEEGVIQQAGFMMYCVRRSLDYVKKAYPENGSKVTADTYASYITTLTQDEDIDLYIDDTEVLVIEYWYKGEPMAPEFPAREEPVEPKPGWVHKAVVAGGVLLEHRTYVYPWYPFVMEWIYPSDESIYGYGDGYDILIPQLIINKINEISIEGAVIQSQGNWVTEEGNIRRKEQFQKYATIGGSVLPVVDVNRTTRVPGGNVPSSLFAHYKQELQAMEAVSGRFDVAQGRTPRNIQAASAIALLLQQAGGRVRQRSRAVASFVEQLAQKMIDLVGMNYTDERLIRVVGAHGDVQWNTVSKNDFTKTKVWVNPLTGEISEEEYIPEIDIIVTSGTETPTSKAYYSEMAMQLFAQGVIDDVALLDTLQFPRWREILARKQQAAEEAEQKMMMMRQGMMPPPGGPGGPTPGGPPPEGGSPPPQGPPNQGPPPGGLQPTGPGSPEELAQLAAIIQQLQGGA